jgi:hypothetical protein
MQPLPLVCHAAAPPPLAPLTRMEVATLYLVDLSNVLQAQVVLRRKSVYLPSLLGQHSVNSVCNLRCAYSYMARPAIFPGRFMLTCLPLKRAHRVLRSLRAECMGPRIQGGEPFLYKRFPELVRRARTELHYARISIITIGLARAEPGALKLAAGRLRAVDHQHRPYAHARMPAADAAHRVPLRPDAPGAQAPGGPHAELHRDLGRPRRARGDPRNDRALPPLLLQSLRHAGAAGGEGAAPSAQEFRRVEPEALLGALLTPRVPGGGERPVVPGEPRSQAQDQSGRGPQGVYPCENHAYSAGSPETHTTRELWRRQLSRHPNESCVGWRKQRFGSYAMKYAANLLLLERALTRSRCAASPEPLDR